MGEFHAVFKAEELLPDQGRCVEVGGRRLAVFNVGGVFKALDDCCSHEEASLAEGTVEEANGRAAVACPLHGSTFDLETGRALTLPATQPVRAYPVRVRAGRVEVEV